MHEATRRQGDESRANERLPSRQSRLPKSWPTKRRPIKSERAPVVEAGRTDEAMADNEEADQKRVSDERLASRRDRLPKSWPTTRRPIKSERTPVVEAGRTD